MARKFWGLFFIVAVFIALAFSSTSATPTTTANSGLGVSAVAAAPNSPVAGVPLAPVADQQILDDLIVDGSACIGQDCNNGESFGFDTIRLKENNLRIKFQDTSNSASFPSNDWTIVANDSSNGGNNYLAFEDTTAGTKPFLVEAGAGNNALYVDSNGQVGFGTNSPVVELHSKDGDTPTLRLEQDNSVGWGTQIWDVAGNETNFFIRDASNSSNLPFRIMPNTKENSLVLNDDRVGIGTKSPQKSVHIAESTGIVPTIRLAQGNTALWDINGDPAAFSLTDNVNATTPFKVTAAAKDNSIVVNATGQVGLGTSTPAHSLHIAELNGVTPVIRLAEENTALWDVSGGTTAFTVASVVSGTTPLYIATEAIDNAIYVAADGNVGIGTNNPTAQLYINGSTHVNGAFTRSSDRNLKENIEAVDNNDVLNQILETPVYYWNYTADAEDRTHLGPMAQDFNANSNLGDDTTIDTLDVTGALIASVQALSANIDAKDAQIEALTAENAELLARLEALEVAVAQILADKAESDSGE
ncbi:MAG: tail fiber domain-containing protein [Anaerolineae bacterium]